MRYVMAAIWLALSGFGVGCVGWSGNSGTTLIGGKRVMFYPAGTDVPAVGAAANTNGWYSLTAEELNAIVNP